MGGGNASVISSWHLHCDAAGPFVGFGVFGIGRKLVQQRHRFVVLLWIFFGSSFGSYEVDLNLSKTGETFDTL